MQALATTPAESLLPPLMPTALRPPEVRADTAAEPVKRQRPLTKPTVRPSPTQNALTQRADVQHAPGPPTAAPGAAPSVATGAMVIPRSAVAEQQLVQPIYPDAARRRHEQGEVLLRVEVTADGHPTAVTVARSSGFAVLDAAAMAAVQQWYFHPATRGGVPIAARAEVPIRFRLQD
jgi:protein TonB